MSFQNMNDGNSLNYHASPIWLGGGKGWLASIVLLMVFCVSGEKVFADSEPPLIDELLQSVSSDSCQATYSAPEQTLSVPCVTVTDMTTGKTLSYAVKMQQVEGTNPLQFAVSSFAENKDNPPNPCQASYSLESGELSLPCVTVPDQATGKMWSYHAEMQQIVWTQPLHFVVSSLVTNEDSSPSLCLPTDSLGSGELLLPCVEVTSPVEKADGQRNTRQNITDTYPYRNVCPDDGDDYADQWNFYVCECVSYVAWKLNEAGVPFHNNNYPVLRPDVNDRWSHAFHWETKAQREGIPMGANPHKGDVALWRAWSTTSNRGIGAAGHVAYVESVNADGSVNVSEYNVTPFDFRITNNVRADIYIHIIPSANLKLDSPITVSPTPVLQNQPVKISVKISNREGTAEYRGDLYAAFHYKGDLNQSQWEIRLIDKPLPASKDFEYVFDSTINDNSSQSTSRNVTLSPGEYDLYIKGNDLGNDFQPITGGGFPNPITVVVSGNRTASGNYSWNGNGSIINFDGVKNGGSSFGIDKDDAKIHPYSPNSPAVFFQWQVNTSYGTKLKISADGNPGTASISYGGWNSDKVSKKTYKNVNLPFVLDPVKDNLTVADAGWYVVAVSFNQKPANSITIRAEPTFDSATLYPSSVVFEGLMVDGYSWTGNGSIISHSSNVSTREVFGLNQDIARVESSPSVVFFQWQVSSNWGKYLKIDSGCVSSANITVGDWNTRSNDTVISNVSLPYRISANGKADGGWILVKVETVSNSCPSSGGTIGASAEY